jgi:hypothetical protein
MIASLNTHFIVISSLSFGAATKEYDMKKQVETGRWRIANLPSDTFC